MDTLDFSRSPALNNVPKKKLKEWLTTIEESTEDVKDRSVKLIAINRYAESNIPIEYWSLKMERDFFGDPRLKTKYEEYISDLKASYINGSSVCFAGSHGVGKTMAVTCILKKAAQKSYSCLYTTLSDIVNVLTSASSEDKYLARRELALVDFLVIDEVDNRFFASSDAATELYIKNFETILRSRQQNKLPTLICTNSPNIINSFTPNLKQSLGSLFSTLEMFIVLGNDYRGKK